MSLRYLVDDIAIHRIVEENVGTRPAFDFIAGLTPELLEANRHWLEPESLLPGSDDLAFCFQSYVVRTPHHTILIDSCIGNDKPRPRRPGWHLKHDDHYMRALAAAGFRVEDIDYVLCTHLHADHVGWNTRLDNGRWVPTFPNARYLMSGKELDHWMCEHAQRPIECIADSVLPVVEEGRAELVASAHVVSEHVRLVPTPGHTVDHFSVCLGRGRDAAVMTGDLIHSPLQARFPELCARVDHDHALAARTRRTFLARYAGTDTLCCTAHFPAPSCGRIERWDDGFRFVPRST
jgi:glyoxylase-like metal-dependent hydrolase (beta-lactamase superfamily II)